MSDSHKVTTEFALLMSDGSELVVKIAIGIKAKSWDSIANKRIDYFSPYEQVADMKTELAKILADPEVLRMQEENASGN
jgi:hypothetical protein